ncbi:MAG TPA: BTAD domain-containing putative transcriptional regulator [Rhodopila sp.]|uniref:BTAD domain-containing putative transcriptional regulator n=1 Tax=Rhodopila sp. TaxID=2480087 RepID=UPI002C15A134|nr:BTAD domain-containing putative transcriptional regulator [Rhodopila sp.]HVY15283.1 BTAD domain-containing putative transcriptional regulator [Rhodopila sp.]
MRAIAKGRDVRLRSRKARALLAYLALTEGRQETRERLVGLLWSESEEAKARSSLRQVLHELSEDLEAAGFGGLERGRQRIALGEEGLEVDAQVLLEVAQANRLHPKLIDEPFISDSYLRDLDHVDPAFSVWARARRQGFHDHLIRCLETILRLGPEHRDLRRECAQAILNLDPTHEGACRAYMRLSAEIGDVVAAQRAYKTLWDVLDTEYDAEPSPETIALIAEIKQGHIEPEPQPPPSAKVPDIFPEPPQVRVELPALPFDADARLALLIEPFGMMGIEPDSLHLVEGFRHDLMACLVRFREWFVVAGSTLSTDGVVEGRVSAAYCVAATAYRAGEAISLVLTLRELASGIHIWSDRFFLTLSNWFESQQEIVRRIAISLNVQVSMGRLSRISGEPVVSLAVYDLWLRGQAALNRFSAENWTTAAQMFTAAIQREPNFAPGYSSLAQMNNIAHFIHPGVHRSARNEQRTLGLAQKAVALDPMDSRSQLALGWSLAMAKNYRQAAVHMELAHQLNPSDSWALISSALCLGYCGNVEQAARLAARSLDSTLAPTRLHWAYKAQIAFLQSDYAETIEAIDHAQDVMLGMIAWRAAALAHLGDTSEARKSGIRFLNLARSSWVGDEPPTDPAIGRWLLHMFPISDHGIWERLRTGLVAAGIPDGGARHHGW